MDQTVTVRLPTALIGALLEARRLLDDDLMFALKACSDSNAAPTDRCHPGEPQGTAAPSHARYRAEFLGVPIAANSLPDVFGAIVDMTAQVAPEALENLAAVRCRTRRFVARRPEAIHPGNPRLPVHRTGSGWWISRNIGQEDLKRALRALCSVSGLSFGKDVTFSQAASSMSGHSR